MEKSFNWEDWIPKIEAAAKENSPLEIDLPENEWKRLDKEDLASLKSKLSPLAAGRLHLIHGDASDEDRRFLILARLGRCPR